MANYLTRHLYGCLDLRAGQTSFRNGACDEIQEEDMTSKWANL